MKTGAAFLRFFEVGWRREGGWRRGVLGPRAAARLRPSRTPKMRRYGSLAREAGRACRRPAAAAPPPAPEPTPLLRLPKHVLLSATAQVIFSIVVFSTIVDYQFSSRIQFTVRKRRDPGSAQACASCPPLQLRVAGHAALGLVTPRPPHAPPALQMFVGITGFLIALFLLVLYAAGVRAARGLVAFVLDLLWVIFWLAAAGCVTSFLTDMFAQTSNVRASCAFAWLSWFLWIGSAIISFQDWRGGVAGPAPAGGAPTIPNSSVSMV